jgi:hypothetical protein
MGFADAGQRPFHGMQIVGDGSEDADFAFGTAFGGVGPREVPWSHAITSNRGSNWGVRLRFGWVFFDCKGRQISELMKQAAGESSQSYNRRKKRRGGGGLDRDWAG